MNTLPQTFDQFTTSLNEHHPMRTIRFYFCEVLNLYASGFTLAHVAAYIEDQEAARIIEQLTAPARAD